MVIHSANQTALDVDFMKKLEKVLFTITLSLFILMIVLVSIQVLNRYVIQSSIPWTEEMTRISYILMIYVGSALAVIQNNHVRITVFEKHFSPMIRRFIWIVISLISSLFFVVVAFGNYTYMQVNWNAKFPTTPILTIGHVLAIVMTCSGLMAVLYFFNIFKTVPNNKDIVLEHQ